MLKLDNICKTFNKGTINEKKALAGLSLHLEPGIFFLYNAELKGKQHICVQFALFSYVRVILKCYFAFF